MIISLGQMVMHVIYPMAHVSEKPSPDRRDCGKPIIMKKKKKKEFFFLVDNYHCWSMDSWISDSIMVGNHRTPAYKKCGQKKL